jgi:hypothetical protein
MTTNAPIAARCQSFLSNLVAFCSPRKSTCEGHATDQKSGRQRFETGRKGAQNWVPSQKRGTMATERQIATNRANAKRSTGPRTNRGRCASSHNALRHGLSSSAGSRRCTPIDTEGLAEALIQRNTEEIKIAEARQVAQAHSELLRVRAVRTELLASLDPHHCTTDDLRQLLAIERYERIARGKRRLAAKRLLTK